MATGLTTGGLITGVFTGCGFATGGLGAWGLGGLAASSEEAPVEMMTAATVTICRKRRDRLWSMEGLSHCNTERTAVRQRCSGTLI